MTLQVLVATMHQNDRTLPQKMNIQSDAIIGNQCDRNEVETFDFNGHTITYLSFAERGVGLNRNNALMRATADVCLFADDDVVYYDGYPELIRRTYAEHPDADVIIFNMRIHQPGGKTEERVRKDGYVGRSGITRYGTVCISIKNESVKRKNIHFHRMFGGGTEHSNGEDSIFLHDCVNAGLKIYTSTRTLGEVHNEVSTWFNGYTDKFFYDRGVLFGYLYPSLARLLAVYHVVKHRGTYAGYGIKKAIQKMWEGIAHGV